MCPRAHRELDGDIEMTQYRIRDFAVQDLELDSLGSWYLSGIFRVNDSIITEGSGQSQVSTMAIHTCYFQR